MKSGAPGLLSRAPFDLDAQALAWVAQTHARLPRRRRLAQLFNVLLNPFSPQLAVLQAEQPGGITQFLIGGPQAAVQAARSVEQAGDVPLLVSAELEGGNTVLPGCAPFTNAMGMSAAADPVLHADCVRSMAKEARALGVNWAFSPVLDINAAFRSAIVSTRSYGAQVETVHACASRHAQVLLECGLAATAKHWPGEGHDDRDQHLLTTVNPLTEPDWQATHGALYRSLIDSGVPCVMTGHIAMPALATRLGAQGLEAYRPASVSRLLNHELLRGELGFNGLVVSDASTMAGLGSWAPRRQFLPELIENGCDMVLFSDDLAADLDLMEAAMADGRLSEQRVDEALWRVLGLKARQGLHRAKEDCALDDPARKHHRVLAEAVAGRSVTLVKDVQGTLPLHPSRHRRVRLVQQPQRMDLGMFAPPALQLGTWLAERGFEVTPHEPHRPPTPADTDLVLFVVCEEALMTRGHAFLDWGRLIGPMLQAMPRWWHDLPCVLVSFGHPYHLYEAPRMPCVVNAWCSQESVQRAVLQRLLGEAPFTGQSPVDPFCGLGDAVF